MMSKPTGALFGVLTLVAILAVAPSAFAQESQTVNISAGAGSGPTCSQSNNCFDPDVITVAPGTTVEWKNNDKVSHTVTSGNPSDNQTGTVFDSSLIAAGKDFSFTFNNPGTFNYFCQVHPWMTGKVIVSASAAPATGAAPSSSSGTNMPSGSMSTNATSTPSSGMNMSSGSMSTNATSTPSSSQSQQGGTPLGSSYNAPTNVTTSAPTAPAPASQSPQYGSQAPAASTGGVQGQQSGNPLGTPTGTQTTTSSGGTEQPSSAGSDPTPAYGAGIAAIAVM
ncbi:MAG: cupredoxin domain-containing protein, partial [Patescibacteria group bacterium]|nr:cupredoxin domain-containing protein [Patescibacteria group bacterium]